MCPSIRGGRWSADARAPLSIRIDGGGTKRTQSRPEEDAPAPRQAVSNAPFRHQALQPACTAIGSALAAMRASRRCSPRRPLRTTSERGAHRPLTAPLRDYRKTAAWRRAKEEPAAVSPFVSPSSCFWLGRAKERRNHNPRVGGSSPSSGIGSAWKSALSRAGGDAEYIRRDRP